MMLHRIRSFANWIASDLVSAMSAPLAAVYASWARVKPTSAETEPIRITEPPPELRDPVLRHPEGGLEVDGDHAVPPRLVRLQHRAIAVFPEHAGVVIEDVEPAEVARAVLDHATD